MGAQANEVQGGRTVFAHQQHISDPSGVDTIGILACPEEVPLLPHPRSLLSALLCRASSFDKQNTNQGRSATKNRQVQH
nr:hypothetical protein CFP56_25272 [Quercus suber]